MSHLAAVTGTGSCFPATVVTNDDLAKRVDTSDTWIRERTGIRERRVSALGDPAEHNSSLGYRAALRALEMAGKRPEDLDQIIYATVSGDTPLPSTACRLQAKLGAKNAFAFDVGAGCSGFTYGLTIADQFVRSGAVKTSLVVGAEVLSRMVNWDDRNSCVLFGDGAGAVVVERVEEATGSRILWSQLASNGALAPLIQIPAGGTNEPVDAAMLESRAHMVHLAGQETFKEAVTELTRLARLACDENSISPLEVKWFVPHQANLRIMEAVAKRMGFPSERVLVNIDRYGNTSSASIPTVLDEAVRDGRVRKGDILLIDAFGAGVTSGAILIRW